MCEGELKKRLKEHSYRHKFEACGDIDVIMCNDAFDESKNRPEKDVVKFEDLSKILDEANADFPMPKKMLDNLTGKATDLGSLGTYDPIDIAKWFVKWFGEKK